MIIDLLRSIFRQFNVPYFLSDDIVTRTDQYEHPERYSYFSGYIFLQNDSQFSQYVATESLTMVVN